MDTTCAFPFSVAIFVQTPDIYVHLYSDDMLCTCTLPWNLHNQYSLRHIYTPFFMAQNVHSHPSNISSEYPSGKGVFQHSAPQFGHFVSFHFLFFGSGTFSLSGIGRYPPLSVVFLGIIFTYIFFSPFSGCRPEHHQQHF